MRAALLWLPLLSACTQTLYVEGLGVSPDGGRPPSPPDMVELSDLAGAAFWIDRYEASLVPGRGVVGDEDQDQDDDGTIADPEVAAAHASSHGLVADDDDQPQRFAARLGDQPWFASRVGLELELTRMEPADRAELLHILATLYALAAAVDREPLLALRLRDFEARRSGVAGGTDHPDGPPSRMPLRWAALTTFDARDYWSARRRTGAPD